MIVIATHAVFFNNADIYGPPHAVSLFLQKKHRPHLFIKHSLYSNHPSTVDFIDGGKKTHLETIPYKKKPLYLQYFAEILDTMRIVRGRKKKVEVFIGVNPLNALAGILLKTGGTTKKVVYFSADFALKRFDSKLLNRVYLFLDMIAMKLSDETWSVSTRIVEYRRSKGLKDSKNILFPNAPPFEDLKKFRTLAQKPYRLIMVSLLYKGIGFEELLTAVSRIRKKYSKVTLHIIGDGEERKNIEKRIKSLKLEKTVTMYGAVNHDKVHTLMAQSYIGFAPYKITDDRDFRYYSDSMKIRDYLACGVPIIATGNTATGYEISKEKAGYVVPLKANDIYDRIDTIFKNKQLYDELKANALRVAKQKNITSILKDRLTALGAL